jgi:hypothetical protein
MTKDIKQIQEENRKLILEAIHGCEYEEALFNEIYFGCKLLDTKGNESTVVLWEDESVNFLDHFNCLNCIDEQKFYNYFSVLGQTITLSRVLLALGDKVLFCEGYLCEHSVTNDGLIITTNHIQWDLTKETLEEQAPEVQIAINQLLTK